jgi:hypothetical protein
VQHEVATALGHYLGRTYLEERLEHETFSDLSRIILEPVKPSSGGWCGTGRMRWWRNIEQLRHLSQDHPRGTDRPSVIVLSPRLGGYGLDLALQYWRDVVGLGEDGAWHDEVLAEPEVSAPSLSLITLAHFAAG